MVALRPLALAFALGSTLGISCFNEPLPPSTFRFACDADADCGDLEFCRSGVCERSCSQVTAAEDCPMEDGFATCFNGACASTCGIGSSVCPSGQTCLDLGFGQDVGICGLECDAGENADICPQGEVCIAQFGSCAVDCSAGQACPEGFSCLLGVCAPEGTEIPGVPPDSGDSSGGGPSTGDAPGTDSSGSASGTE